MTNIIIIPARLQATRFPNKPLIDINGKPMIVRVMEQSIKADIGEVYVACGDVEIADAVEKFGGNAIMTDNDLPSGSDRIYQAYEKIGENVDNIINVQGDIPTVDIETIRGVANALNGCDVSTACAKITDTDEINNPNVVKCYADFSNDKIATANDFSRDAVGDAPYYHHIGIYGYTVNALKKFVSLPPSQNEIDRRLEQMRLLDNGLTIQACLVNEVPVGIDTPEDLEKIK